MGSGCATVSRASTPGEDLVTGVWSDGRIGTFRGLHDGKPDYGGVVFGSKKTERRAASAGMSHLSQRFASSSAPEFRRFPRKKRLRSTPSCRPRTKASGAAAFQSRLLKSWLRRMRKLSCRSFLARCRDACFFDTDRQAERLLRLPGTRRSKHIQHIVAENGLPEFQRLFFAPARAMTKSRGGRGPAAGGTCRTSAARTPACRRRCSSRSASSCGTACSRAAGRARCTAGMFEYHQWPFVTTFGKIQA